MSEEYLLQMENITKIFPGTVALNKARLNVRRASVHALIGENGAGKSTMMKVLMGLYTPEEGSVVFKGEPMKRGNVKDALQRGVSMIHQELSAIPDMTVAQNIFLGKEVRGSIALNDKRMNEETEKLMQRLEIDIDPTTKMRALSVANTQMVEIAKAISYNADLIIMDEPTSALTEKEVEHLYKIVNSLKAEGRSIIYITHKMDEIFHICDEVTALRDGEFAGAGLVKDLTKDQMIAMMVGRQLGDYYYKDDNVQDAVALKVENLTVKGLFENVSFEVRKGEILGFSGLLGSGRTEVIETIFGLHKPTGGNITLFGQKLDIKNPVQAIKHGMGLVTEDRKLTGLFAPLSVKDNMSMAGLYQYTKGGVVNDRKLAEDCKQQVEDLRTKTTGIGQIINNLSGGNQQKVLISRWLLISPKILFLDEPTRGIDVHAKAEIYRLINDLAKRGTAIIMVSSEMPELLGMSDNILVMHEGHKTGQLPIAEATQVKLLTLAMGEALPDTNVS